MCIYLFIIYPVHYNQNKSKTISMWGYFKRVSKAFSLLFWLHSIRSTVYGNFGNRKNFDQRFWTDRIRPQETKLTFDLHFICSLCKQEAQITLIPFPTLYNSNCRPNSLHGSYVCQQFRKMNERKSITAVVWTSGRFASEILCNLNFLIVFRHVTLIYNLQLPPWLLV